MLIIVLNRGVTMSDFHYKITVAKQIHNNDVIATSIENFGKENTLAFKTICVNCVFCFYFGKLSSLKIRV